VRERNLPDREAGEEDGRDRNASAREQAPEHQPEPTDRPQGRQAPGVTSLSLAFRQGYRDGVS
jgi:hypothetical protein